VDAQSHAYVAGAITGTVNFGNSSVVCQGSGHNLFLAKDAPDGSNCWAFAVPANIQSVFNEGYTAIDLTGDGRLFFAGNFRGTCDFDPGPAVSNITSSGGNNIFVASYTGDGALRWAFNVPTTTTTGSQGGHRVAVDRAARVLVAGWFTGGADFNPAGPVTFAITNHGAGADVFLAQYTYNGALNWVRGFGATNTPPSPDNNIAAGLARDEQLSRAGRQSIQAEHRGGGGCAVGRRVGGCRHATPGGDVPRISRGCAARRAN
jgi:hypothetical protein